MCEADLAGMDTANLHAVGPESAWSLALDRKACIECLVMEFRSYRGLTERVRPVQAKIMRASAKGNVWQHNSETEINEVQVLSVHGRLSSHFRSRNNLSKTSLTTSGTMTEA